MVDQQRSGLQHLQCALRAGGDLENIFIVTHAEHDGFLIRGSRPALPQRRQRLLATLRRALGCG